MKIKSFARDRYLVGNGKGFAMLTIVAILLLVAVMIAAGLGIRALLIKKEKLGESAGRIVGGVEGAADAIFSFAQANKRLPCGGSFPGTNCTSDQFVPLLQNRNDSWGQPFQYVYDDSMAGATVNEICGKNDTNLRVSVTGPSEPIAFIVLSKGPNMNNQTFQTRGITGTTTITVTVRDVGTPNIASLDNPGITDLTYDDVVRWVTLRDLKIKLNCSGGNLRIVNNELPNTCSGQSYSVTVYADGGERAASSPYYTWNYTVTASPNYTWTPSSATSTDNYYTVSGTPTCTTPPCTIPFNFTLNDAGGNPTVTKTLNAKVKFCGPPPPPGAQVSYALNLGNFPAPSGSGGTVTVDQINKTISLGNNVGGGILSPAYAGCIWSPQCSATFPGNPPPPCVTDNYTLKGKTMRVYFEFKFPNIDTDGSLTYGDGFTFALMQGNNSSTAYCGGGGASLGFGSLPVTKSIAVEFDTLTNLLLNNDPWLNNHVAVVKDASVNHAGSNPVCNGSNTGCVYDSVFGNSYPQVWLEDNLNHNARIEIETLFTDNTCTTMSATGNYAKIKVWVDMNSTTNPKCNDLTNDYKFFYPAPADDPKVTHCFLLDTGNVNTTMNTVKFGFTEGTAWLTQNVITSNFGIGFYSLSCPPLSIATTSLPNGYSGQNYNVAMAGSGGLTPYVWGSMGLPTNLVINPSTGVISGILAAADVGTYSPMITLTDSCSTPNPQLVSQTYTITVGRHDNYNVRNRTGATFWVTGGQYGSCRRTNNYAGGCGSPPCAFNVNYDDASVVSIYTDNLCSVPAPLSSVSYQNAFAVDESGATNPQDGNLRINNLWQLIDR